MQIAMMAVLAISFLAVVIACSVLGIRLFCRTRKLSKYSDQLGMRFSREDTFQLPLRYREFAVFSLGHSPRASNILYGPVDSRYTCAFDFRFEVGHGTRRVCRHYQIIVVDCGQNDSADLIMWNDMDAGVAPLIVRQVDGRVGCWAYAGSGQLAAVVGEHAGQLATSGLSLQILEGRILTCIPTLSGKDYSSWMTFAIDLANVLCDFTNTHMHEETTGGGDNHLEKPIYT